MLPIQYKSAPDAIWTTWNNGPIQKEIIDNAGIGYAPFKINGIIVYSFKFADGKIWNINQGWLN